MNEPLHGQRQGWRWASLLNATTQQAGAADHAAYVAGRTAGHAADRHAFIFVMLDDVLLSRSTFNVDKLVDLSRRRRIDVLSPVVLNASQAFMQVDDVPTGSDGRRPELRMLNAVETYATLFTAAAWRCFTSMFANEVLGGAGEKGAIGYGYDMCFAAHCAHGLVRPGIFGRRALALAQSVQHDEYENRTLAREARRKQWSEARRSRAAPHPLSRYLGNGSANASTHAAPAVNTTAVSTAALQETLAAPRRLALDLDYKGVMMLGLGQMRDLTRWVLKTNGRRCSHLAARKRDNFRWFAYEW